MIGFSNREDMRECWWNAGMDLEFRISQGKCNGEVILSCPQQLKERVRIQGAKWVIDGEWCNLGDDPRLFSSGW